MEVTSKSTKRRVTSYLKIHYNINKNNLKSTKLYQQNGIILKFQNNQPKNFNLLQIYPSKIQYNMYQKSQNYNLICTKKRENYCKVQCNMGQKFIKILQ